MLMEQKYRSKLQFPQLDGFYHVIVTLQPEAFLFGGKIILHRHNEGGNDPVQCRRSAHTPQKTGKALASLDTPACFAILSNPTAAIDTILSP